MTNVSKNKVSVFFRTLMKMFHLNLKTSFYAVTAILVAAPVAFLAFLAMNASASSIGILDVLQKSPSVAVMAIISGLDIITGYSLWVSHEKLFDNRQLFRGMMLAVAVQQALVGNLIVAGLAVVAFLFGKGLPVKKATANIVVALPTVILTLMYVGCLTLNLALLGK
ncbi:MAG: hypothetical protein LKG24_03320 [Lacticaseibacillus songhuajiangensis]|nr:hypothetical protein [Lacticaseibacillus songhuajiangensis]